MLDEKDTAILEELMKDSRKTTKAIAKELDIPRATVHDRIDRLERKGVIRKYTAIPDYREMGLGVTAFNPTRYFRYVRAMFEKIVLRISGSRNSWASSSVIKRVGSFFHSSKLLSHNRL